MNKKISYRELVKQAARQMDLPQEVLLDVPGLELCGNSELLIQRHHGIIEYSNELLKIAAAHMTICVKGSELELIAMTETE
ncbi:MAG: YabP/YqfC family sporulation protein, partial [Angelakisella sp.]